MVRGLAPEGIALRDELSLVEGRLFEPGLRELIVGRNTQNEFANLDVGDQVTLRDGPWAVVGVFSTGGGVEESSLIADAETLQSAYRRNGFNSVRVRLESPEALQTFRDALTSDPASQCGSAVGVGSLRAAGRKSRADVLRHHERRGRDHGSRRDLRCAQYDVFGRQQPEN